MGHSRVSSPWNRRINSARSDGVKPLRVRAALHQFLARVISKHKRIKGGCRRQLTTDRNIIVHQLATKRL